MLRFPASDPGSQAGSSTLPPQSVPNATDPFLKYYKKYQKSGRLTQRLNEVPGLPSQWQQVMSYAWAIFRQVSRFETTWNLACEWGAAFDRAYTLPYVNIVLPACCYALGDPLGRLLCHLRLVLIKVESTGNAQTMVQHLVRLWKLLNQVKQARLKGSPITRRRFLNQSACANLWWIKTAFLDGCSDLSELTSVWCVQELPVFLTDPTSPERCPSVWNRVLELFRYQRFWKLAKEHPEHETVNEAIKQWGWQASHALSLFAEHGDYSELSHRVLKFYLELRKTAAALTGIQLAPEDRTCLVEHEGWKAGYELIVSTHVTDHVVRLGIDLVPFIPTAVLAG